MFLIYNFSVLSKIKLVILVINKDVLNSLVLSIYFRARAKTKKIMHMYKVCGDNM